VSKYCLSDVPLAVAAIDASSVTLHRGAAQSALP
jgi:hypothetical protein